MSSDAPPPLPVPSSEPDPDDSASQEFAHALEEFERGRAATRAAAGAANEPAVGARVRGRVVSVGEEFTLLDFGGRSEAVAETRLLRAEDGSLPVGPGDELQLFVVSVADQIVLAPSLRTDSHAVLRQVREAHAAGVPVTGRVTGRNSGGLEVDLGGARGFCPLSQIESTFCADPSVYVGRSLEFLVTAAGDARGGIVLSRRQLLRRAEEEKARELLARLKPGDELDGTVARLEAFGAFVDLGGVDGLVHVSEIRHERTGHPAQVLRPGEPVHVRVLRVESSQPGRPRISLSIKAVAPDPWTGIEARYPVGSRVQGVVARLADFGAFVSLAPGVDGLVHVSEAAPGRIGHVKEVLAPGQPVEAVVLAVDGEKRRIALSLRAAQAADAPPPRAPAVGEVVEGTVGGVKPFGVFVDLPGYGPRVSGLLPREETGEPHGANLTRRFQAGQPLSVEVREVKDGRIRLRLAASAPASEPAARASAAPAPAAPRPEAELTTMGLALRKAMEEARRRAEAGGRS